MPEPEECIRCGEAPAVDENGYCGHCHWAVRAEIEEGFYHLREYLGNWASYADWCAEHDEMAAESEADTRPDGGLTVWPADGLSPPPPPI